MESLLALAWPVVMAVAAVGAVLLIKITRRRQATRSGQFGGAVPARPMSAAHARHLTRTYLVTAILILGAVVLLALFVSSAH